MQTLTFKEIGLAPHLLAAVDQLGYESPSQIQAEAIPIALTGIDVVGLSETGSGKTAAFVLPALQSLKTELKKPQVLIMCPTRELCVQVCEEVHRLGSTMKNLHALPVYGGAPIDRQMRALRAGVHVVVGTPGRLQDHLRRGTLKTDAIKLVVLDEADRMLDMGFVGDMEAILAELPTERQVLFFSATMNKAVERLIGQFARDPHFVRIKRKSLTVASIEQICCEVSYRSKIEAISRFLDLETPRLAIIFCNTKRAVDECAEALATRGYSVDRIHGDIAQAARERVLKRFREGKVEVLVATDVAARGLDIDEIDLVFNYEMPQDAEDYVHRIGRTGRAGRVGKAISLISGRDLYQLESIERYTRHPIRTVKVPTLEDVTGQRSNQLLDMVKEKLQKQDFKPQLGLLDRLLDAGHLPSDIIGALFAILDDNNRRQGETIQEDFSNKPVRDRSASPRPQRGGDQRPRGGGGHEPWKKRKIWKGRKGK
jgi:ATP-dependent RNA helicase DeaD